MRVYLTGFMGSGKTVLGKCLSQELACGFADLDALIEKDAGRTVAQIFRDDGERAFRKLEKRQLRKTARLENHVIALGGGTLLHGRTMKWVRSLGVVVFIDVPVDELVRRLASSGESRPLIADAVRSNDPETAIRERVVELMNRRRRAYERAHINYRPTSGSPRQDAKNLARLLQVQTVQPGHRRNPD